MQAFKCQEVEGLISLQCATERTAVLLAIERRFAVGRKVEGIASIKDVIAEIAEDAAVQIVAAGLGNDIDDAARGATILGAVTVAVYLKLLHAFLPEYRAHAAGVGVGGSAIHHDGIAAPVIAAERQAGLRRLRDAEIG